MAAPFPAPLPPLAIAPPAAPPPAPRTPPTAASFSNSAVLSPEADLAYWLHASMSEAVGVTATCRTDPPADLAGSLPVQLATTRPVTSAVTRSEEHTSELQS